jgi:hypothetical protein
MISLRPRTPAGISAIAAALNEGALSHHCKERENDRDRYVVLVTRFLDGLIELGRRGSMAIECSPPCEPTIDLKYRPAFVHAAAVSWGGIRAALLCIVSRRAQLWQSSKGGQPIG